MRNWWLPNNRQSIGRQKNSGELAALRNFCCQSHIILLQKLRDAIHEIVGKLTGRAKRQAQTVEGKLQAAFEAASQQAESLQNRQTNGTINDWRSSYR